MFLKSWVAKTVVPEKKTRVLLKDSDRYVPILASNFLNSIKYLFSKNFSYKCYIIKTVQHSSEKHA